MEADMRRRAAHQRLVSHVLAFAVFPLDTKARRAGVPDDRALENAVPCAARSWPQKDQTYRATWAVEDVTVRGRAAVRADVPSNCLCTARPTKASSGSTASIASPPRRPETDGISAGLTGLVGSASAGSGGRVAGGGGSSVRVGVRQEAVAVRGLAGSDRTHEMLRSGSASSLHGGASG